MAFDISGISSDFRNELEGGLYNIAVKEGTVWSLVNQMNGIAGKQDLNILDFNPTWKNVAASDADYDVQAGTAPLTRAVIDVTGQWFSVGFNQNQLDATFARASQSEDPAAYASSEIIAQAAAKMRQRVSQQFYTGFAEGGTPTNGLSDITGTTVATGAAAFAAGTALAKMSLMHADFADSSHGGRTDAAFILSTSDYLAYRQGLRLAGLNDILQGDAASSGVQTSAWVDQPNISVIGDPSYTGEPLLLSLSNVVFASKNLSENEQPDFFYSKDKNIYIARGFVYGGVQALEAANIFVNDDA